MAPGDLEQDQKRRRAHDSLLQQVEAAIENQLRLNEKYGRRSLLHSELDRLEKALERASALLDDAIIADDELQELIPMLEKRQQELSELLKVSRPAYQPAYGLPLRSPPLKSADLTATDTHFSNAQT